MTQTDQAIENEAAGRPHNAGQEEKPKADTKHRPTCMCNECLLGRETVTALTTEKYGVPIGTKVDPKTGAVVCTVEEIAAQVALEQAAGKKKKGKKTERKAVVRALTPAEQKVADLQAALQAAQEEAKRLRADAAAYAVEQRKAAEAKRAELQAEADAKNPPIHTQIGDLGLKITAARDVLDALVAEQEQLKKSLVVVPTVEEIVDGKPASTPREEGAPKVNRIREDGSKAWETPMWLFWKEYQRIHKVKESHAKLNQMAKKMDLDVNDRSAENMALMHDYMTGKRTSK